MHKLPASRERGVMLEFVQAIHEAFSTQSKWAFVFYCAGAFAILAFIVVGFLAYIVDSGYQRKLQEQRASGNTETALQAAPALTSVPTLIRLKFSADQNKMPEMLEEKNIFRWYNLGYVKASQSTMKAVQAFWTVYLTFDKPVPVKEILVKDASALYEVKDSSPRSAVITFYPMSEDTVVTIEVRN
jgi:hypothetical protein